jgi:RNA polymerase primary sigma factor
MICITPKVRRRRVKLSDNLIKPGIQRSTSIAAPPQQTSPAEKLDFIDNPQFHLRGAEKHFPSERELAAQEVNPKSQPSPVTRRVSAPFALACETPLLTPTEEQRLFRRMNFCKCRAVKLANRSGSAEKVRTYADEAEQIRNRIIRSNTRLVVSIAKSFVDPHNTFEDLFSDGVVSLVQAAEKFDIERGFRFSTYATRAIRRNLYRIVTNRRKDRTRFSTGALDGQTEPEETDRGSTISEARWDDLQSRLRTLLASLDPRERQIVRARFGLESTRDVQTLQSLAKKMGICKERVRQLEKRALDKLRQMASDVRLEEHDA